MLGSDEWCSLALAGVAASAVSGSAAAAAKSAIFLPIIFGTLLVTYSVPPFWRPVVDLILGWDDDGRRAPDDTPSVVVGTVRAKRSQTDGKPAASGRKWSSGP